MRLLTRKLKKELKKIPKRKEKNPIIKARFFGSRFGTWYVTNYNSKNKIFYAFMSIFDRTKNRWGYFSLEELESIRFPFNLKVELDKLWKPKRFNEIEMSLFNQKANLTSSFK